MAEAIKYFKKTITALQNLQDDITNLEEDVAFATMHNQELKQKLDSVIKKAKEKAEEVSEIINLLQGLEK